MYVSSGHGALVAVLRALARAAGRAARGLRAVPRAQLRRAQTHPPNKREAAIFINNVGARV